MATLQTKPPPQRTVARQACPSPAGLVQKLPLYSAPKIFLISPNPHQIEGLEKAWPNLEIFLSKPNPYFKKAQKKGYSINFLQLPQIKKTALILRQPQVQQKLKPGSRLLVFKNSLQITKLAQKNKWQILLSPAKFNQILEDKINFLKFAKKHQLPILPTKVLPCQKIQFQKSLVIQTRQGHAGNSTFFVQNQKSLSCLQKRIGEWPVKITPYHKLPTFSLNLCVTTSQIFYTQPFYQITGDQNLNPNPGGSGGIDFDLAQQILTPDLFTKIRKLAEQVGTALQKINYRGICGLDFLVDVKGENLFLLELNPRLVSNLGFLTQQQNLLKEIPLLTLHLAEFLKVKISKAKIPQCSQVCHGRFELKHSKFRGNQ